VNEIDAAFQLPVRVLDWTSARARALQTNLAHASEPGYRRVDVDFAALVKAVRDEREKGKTGAIARAQPSIEVDATAQPGPSGNTVEFELEQVQIDKNALLHELATLMVNGKLNTLRNAIRGTAT
jgi:flagellar basal-body rod protein FlgB